jgi:hypothetical protein
MCELQRNIDPVIIDRINTLAEILTRSSEANHNYDAGGHRHEVCLSDELETMQTSDLKRILETFEQGEVRQERLPEVIYDDSIPLFPLLLVQHRFFEFVERNSFVQSKAAIRTSQSRH